jgi:hypothetical protein
MFDAKSHLDSLRPYISSGSMIRLADFLNDSTLLVAWQSIERYKGGILDDRIKVFFDIWRKSGGEWSLLAGDIRDFNPMPSDTFSRSNMMEFSFAYSGAEASYCYRFTPVARTNMADKTYAQILREAEEYMLEHEPRFSLLRFRARTDNMHE